MLPIIGVPETIRRGLAPYRPLFCRDEGFAHVSRYVTGLTLQRRLPISHFISIGYSVFMSSILTVFIALTPYISKP